LAATVLVHQAGEALGLRRRQARAARLPPTFTSGRAPG